MVQICSVSIQHKRNNDGRVGLIKHRESSMGILHRYANSRPSFRMIHCNYMLGMRIVLILLHFLTHTGANSSLSSRSSE